MSWYRWHYTDLHETSDLTSGLSDKLGMCESDALQRPCDVIKALCQALAGWECLGNSTSSQLCLWVSFFLKSLLKMASSVSGQDEPNTVMWLAILAGKMALFDPLGIFALSRRKNFPEIHIINPLLTRHVKKNVKCNVNLFIVAMHLAIQALSLASLQACH